MGYKSKLRGPELDALLDGGRAHTGALSNLIAAASRPVQPHELRGLDAAMAAFVAAPPAGTVAAATTEILLTEPAPTRRFAKRKLALNVLIPALGVAAFGGAAFAAATGHLPGQHATAHHAGSGTSTTAALHTSSAPGKTTSATDSGNPSPGSPPQAAEFGLCHSWLNATNDPTSPSQHKYAVLLKDAGGADKVTAFCTALIASHPTPSSDGAANSTHPSGKPSDVGSSTHPSGKPSAKATHTPGKPSKTKSGHP